jgi:hypothetical protein
LAIFRDRFPSRQEIALAFAACVFPVFSWAIVQFLDRLPAWMFYLKPWEIISMFAYTQMFALAESLFLLVLLVGVALIAPARFIRERFVALGSAGVLLTALWLVAVQYRNEIEFLQQMKPPAWAAWALYLASIGIAWGLIVRFESLKQFMDALADRLSILLYVYLPISAVSVLVVVVRNVSG